MLVADNYEKILQSQDYKAMDKLPETYFKNASNTSSA